MAGTADFEIAQTSRAFRKFCLDWQKVPMGPPEFIDLQWAKIKNDIDAEYGDGMGQRVADMYDASRALRGE